MDTDDTNGAAAAPAKREQTIFDMFETDASVETIGVMLRYGPKIRILVARAGGANKQFEKIIKNLTKPHRQMLKAVQSGAGSDADAETLEAIMQEAYSKTVVLGWEGITEKATKNADGSFTPGAVIECTPANVISLFKRIPQMWIDIRDFASNYMNFLTDVEDVEEVVKN